MLMKTEIDVSRGLALADLLLRKLPYVTNNALTRTARELVELEREELESEFTIRKPFIPSRVRITKWARPGSLWTRVEIDRNVQGGKLLLTMFETGGEKIPEAGSDLAVPPTGGAVRPSMSEPMTPRLLYKRLNMQRVPTSGGRVQYKGEQRTFVIPNVGVFQRTSSRQRIARAKRGVAVPKGKDEDLMLLYRFRTGAQLKAQMHFLKTAREFVTRRFPQIWREELARELAGR